MPPASTGSSTPLNAAGVYTVAETAYQALLTKPITLTLAAKRFPLGSGVVMVSGSPTDPVDVTLEISKKKAKK